MRVPNYKVIPIFDDNYIFVLTQDSPTAVVGNYIVVDPGEAKTLVSYLNSLHHQDIKLNILVTHHHPDHVGGLKELTNSFPCEIWGPQQSRERVPEIKHGLRGHENLSLLGFQFEVLALPGHTLDHIAFFEKNLTWLFSGDVLFNLGCGRLFEGDFQTAFDSLQIIKNLPGKTQVFCTHEYTENNILFALHQAKVSNNTEWLSRLNELHSKVNQLRSQNIPTVPFLLGQDKLNNPFLLVASVDEFKATRIARNLF